MTVSIRCQHPSVRLGLTLYVACLVTQSAAAAAQPRNVRAQPASPPAMTVPAPGSLTPYGPLPPPAPPFRDTVYGARANPGPPGSPGFLHPHYPEYQTRYGIWYQPDSFSEPAKAIYRPSPFRPRGFGNLFYEPCRPDRMDYARAVVDDLPSRYGPAYYPHYTEPSECLVRPTRTYVPPVWGSAEAGQARR